MMQTGERNTESYAMERRVAGVESLRRTLHYPDASVVIDMDGTTKEPFGQGVLWPDGTQRRMTLSAIAAFRTLYQKHIPIGVNTDQTAKEMWPWITEVAHLVLNEKQVSPRLVFNGFILAERGNVLVGNSPSDIEILTSHPEEVVREKNTMEQMMRTRLSYLDETQTWGELEDMTASEMLVRLAPEIFQGNTTLALWEKARGQQSELQRMDADKLLPVQSYVENIMRSLNVRHLETFECGDGVLLILPKNSSKAHPNAMQGLKERGFVAAHAVYAADGRQDIPFAQHVGGSIAVGNAEAGLFRIADYPAVQFRGDGFGEAIGRVFPREYEHSFQQLLQETDS